METTEIVFIVLLMAVTFMLAFLSYGELRKTKVKHSHDKLQNANSGIFFEEFYPIAPRKVTKEELEIQDGFSGSFGLR